MRGLFVFQRDLRLEDQTGFHQALNNCDELLLTVLIDPALNCLNFANPLGFNEKERFRAALSLAMQLKTRQLEALCGIADTVTWITALCNQYQIQQVWLNAVNEPKYLLAYKQLEMLLNKNGIKLTVCQDSLAVPFELLRKKNNEPYQVFTPFYKLWKSRLSQDYLAAYDTPWEQSKILKPILETFEELTEVKQGIERFKALESSLLIDPSSLTTNPESIAAQWTRFKENKLSAYSVARDFPAIEGTSELSLAINNGQISFRKLVLETMHLPDGESFLRQLAWRSFYQQILFEFPEVAETAFKEKYRNLAWGNDLEYFEKWKAGETGFDLIDAAMIQLKTEGKMPNRLRMLTASFLVKQLDIDWRWGEAYFYKMLKDGDLAPNNGGWQWCASTGTDAQPYFRRFNPIIQADKFDHNGAYTHKWLDSSETSRFRQSLQPCVDLKQSVMQVQMKFKQI